MTRAAAVDPDNLDTWPDALRNALAPLVANVDPETLGADLHVPLSHSQFVRLLGGRPLRAYHSTRLLPHEVEGIRRMGLRALTPDHVERRISEAVAAGSITTDEAAMFRAGTVHAIPGPGARDGQVCAVVGRTLFADDPDGVELLLSLWGGEAIYWRDRPGVRDRAARLGLPSVVVVDLPLAGVKCDASPELSSVFGAHLAGLLEPAGEINYFADVPGLAVVDIWQPGSPDYDRYPSLPR